MSVAGNSRQSKSRSLRAIYFAVNVNSRQSRTHPHFDFELLKDCVRPGGL